MASNKRTIYLGMDASNFTGSAAEVTRQMGLLDSQFKLAQAEAKNYGTANDEVGIKVDYLKQKIDLQAKKVEEAKKALEKSKEEHKEGGKEVDNLKNKLIKEQTALEKLKGSLNEAEKAQEDLNKQTGSFGGLLRDVAGDLGLTSPALEKFASKFDGVNASVGTAVLGIGAMISGLVSCSVELAHTADDLLTLSSVTGMTTDELQKLQYASDFVDVSVDTMSGAITKLTSNMDKTRRGTGEAADVFNKLHIRITDAKGALRDSNDVFYEAIDKLGKIKNETERDSMAMAMFGKSAKELNPLIEAGSDKLRELGVEAENLGLVLSGEDLQKAGEFNDALDRMKDVADGLKNTLGKALLEPLTKLFEVISKIPVPILEIIVKLTMAVTTILLVVKAIKSISETTSSLRSFFSIMQGGMSKTTLIVLGVVAALIALAAIIAVIIGRGNDLNRTMENVGKTVTDVRDTVNGAQSATYSASNHASGTLNFKGGRTWVGEAGPELVTLPGGSQITPATQSAEVNYWNITIDAKSVTDFNRVVEMAQAQRMAVRRV